MQQAHDRSWICPVCNPRPLPEQEKTYHGPPVPRNGLMCLLLGIVTLGIYFIYYNYRVFAETSRQLGKKHLGGLLVASIIASVAAVVVAFYQLRDVPLGGTLPPTPPQAIFLSSVGAVAWSAYLYLEVARMAQPARAISAPIPPAVLPAIILAGHALSTLFPGGISLAFGVLEIAAWLFLNAGINQWWQNIRQDPEPRPPGEAGASLANPST